MSSKNKKDIKLKQENKKKKTNRISIKRFVITYFILTGIFFLVREFAPLEKYLDVNNLYSRFIVFITHSILSLLQIQSSYHGTVINLPGISLNVVFGCNGLEAVLIYSIAVIAFPVPWKTKLIGIVIGFLVLQVVNIIRTVGLAYSAVNFKNLFEILHIYVTQGFMIAIALGVFFLFLNYARKKQEVPE